MGRLADAGVALSGQGHSGGLVGEKDTVLVIRDEGLAMSAAERGAWSRAALHAGEQTESAPARKPRS
jgi:hypothetical protein